MLVGILSGVTMDLTLLTHRLASIEDLNPIVELLLDDELGRTREDKSGSVQNYIAAFEKIISDSSQELIVTELHNEIVATLHLTFIQYLTYQGGKRAQIEAVRVKSSYRGQGIGVSIMRYAIERARIQHVHLVQLTTDKSRSNTVEFYRSLGFTDSHIGMKLSL